ncbi:hypothetical protein EV424DRAFT_1352390 [Suillus variegatus]|nr:hypothetical protein EV424DRAFT_1352390 [Suillus variegatus]
MVKTKNDTVLDKESSSETRPHKKARVNDPEIMPALEEEVNDGGGHVDNGAEITSTVNAMERVAGSTKSATGDLNALPTTSKHSSGASQSTLAVKTVIPHPTKQMIDDTEVEEYNDALKLRLQKLSEYTNPKANIYALGKLLPTATWGPYKPVNDRSKMLCDPATGEPLTIWVVGRIAKMWFVKQGRPESQASITVLPLSQSLARQSGLLLTKFSNPTLSLNQQKVDIIRAMKWQNAKAGDTISEPILFDAVYDMRQEGSLKTYSERPLWKLTDLKPGDLILLEMKMTRYSRKTEDNKWHSRAQYEMVAISLLHIADLPEDEAQGMQQIDGLAI